MASVTDIGVVIRRRLAGYRQQEDADDTQRDPRSSEKLFTQEHIMAGNISSQTAQTTQRANNVPTPTPAPSPSRSSTTQSSDPADRGRAGAQLIAGKPGAAKAPALPQKAEAKKDDWNLGTRAMGALRTVGGLIEGVAAGGLAIAPEPTMATKAGAVIVGGHAVDQVQAGVRQMVTGQETKSATEQVVSAGARTMGADAKTADTIGAGVDAGIGIVGGGSGAKVVSGALKGVPNAGKLTTVNVLTQARSAKRAESAAQFGANWGKASLDSAVKSLGAGVKVSKSSTGKVLYTSADGKKQVIQDAAQRYFRIKDMTNTTKRGYLDAAGQAVPNNVLNSATGKMRGMTQGEFNQMTHFKMQ
jgi:hypothetical protein